jgi:hypothetical protein
MTYNATPGHIEDEETNYFISDLLTITGDTRLLIVPTTTSGTNVADSSRNARTLVSNEAVENILEHTKRNYTYVFDGSVAPPNQNVIYHADSADFEFGDGISDDPFSVFALINASATGGDHYIISKQDFGAAEYEWHLHLTDGNPYFMLHDNSASSYIARYRNSAISTGVWYVIGGTYDGGGLIGGIKVYLDGIRVDNTDASGGAGYTSMDGTTAGLSIGALLNNSPVMTAGFTGSIASACICAKELSSDEMWAISKLIKGYFGV